MIIKKAEVLRFLLWMALFPLLTVLVGNAVLLAVPQARETLFALDDGPRGSTLRFGWFCLAYLYWAFTAWFCARLMYGREFPHDATAGWDADQLALADRLARWIPRVLGLAATVPLAVAMFRVSWVHGAVLSGLAAAFLAFVVLRHKLPLLRGPARRAGEGHLRYFKRLPGTAWICIALLVGVSWIVFMALWRDAVTAGRAIGSPALLLVALGGWTLFGSLVLSYWPNTHAWPTFNWLPLVLFAAFSELDNHPVADARHAVSPPDWRDSRVGLTEHYVAWMKRHRAGEPVYFVAVAGGASRAAFWGGMALGQLEDHARAQGRRFAENVFMLSGISGGSLGAAAFVSVVAAEPREAVVTQQLEAMLERDHLAPVVGALLFPDLAQRFLPVFDRVHATDRSLALEGAWIADWRALAGRRDAVAGWWAGPLTAPRDDSRNLPSIVLNTVRLEDGQRMLQSNLRFDLPDAFDLLDARFDTRHLTLAGAVHNSARFPYVSPAGAVRMAAAASSAAAAPGALAASGGAGPPPQRERRATPPLWGHLGDGGYHEGSGAATLADIVDQLIGRGLVRRDAAGTLRACCASADERGVAGACPNPVVLVMLDNQPEADSAHWRRGIDGRPLPPDPGRLQRDWPLPEVSSPPLGLVRAWTSNSVRAEWRLSRLAGDDPRHYVELRLPRCPGRRQPSMNWQLDDDSRQLMKRAAAGGCPSPEAVNLADASLRANLARLKEWIAIEGPVP